VRTSRKSTTGGSAGGSAGGPRRSAQIFEATLALLAELGYDGLTVEGIAARSGVNKTTLYRWWPSKDALLGRALVEARMLDTPIPDTGSLRGDLEVLADHLLTLLTTPPASDVAIAVLGAATRSDRLSAHAQAFFADRMARERVIFERAVGRGELTPDVDPMLLMDLLAGAVWMRVVFRQLPVEPGFVPRAVRTVLTGVGRPAC